MTTRKGQNNQTTVPVLDQNGHPLAPAKPSRVRRWLETGRATKVWIKHIFAVQLHDLDGEDLNSGNFPLNLDPGKTAGIAVTRESSDGRRRAIVGAHEHQHRNQEIRNGLTDRRKHRRNRRGRLRRRPARFDNRANARNKGHLPPSIQSIVDDMAEIVDTIRRLYPISRIRAEYLRFDMQLMQDPDIQGMEYQQGTLQGWQLRHYILHRDGWQCRYCDRPSSNQNQLELDHVVPVSKNGPSVVGNLVTTCHQCNQRKGNQRVEDFLARDPDRLTDIKRQLEQVVPLTPAGQLNSAMPTILAVLEATSLPVTISDGASTAYTRRQLGMTKSHVNDAACLDLPDEVLSLVAKPTALKRQGRHRRQSINCDASGSPASKDFPAYSRRPRSQQGYTTPPSHSTGPRRLHGIASGDLAHIRHHSGQTFIGRTTLDLRKGRVKIKGGHPDGSAVSAQAERTVLIAHRQRWVVSCRGDPDRP